MEPFSKRNSLNTPVDREITKRNEAPSELRSVVLDSAYAAGLEPGEIRLMLCGLLLKRPDEGNWSRSNVMAENLSLIDNCEWYFVYDLIEAIDDVLRDKKLDEQAASEFEDKVNRYHRREGIGWELRDKSVVFRGSDSFQETVTKAQQELSNMGSITASNELLESKRDLSRRPEPDITGSIQHALAAIECVARTITGDPKSTLGSLLSKHPEILPEALRTALEKVWGYSSEMARHLREGRIPSLPEAEFVVGFSGLCCSYLSNISGSFENGKRR
jgi:hypothetical protein